MQGLVGRWHDGDEIEYANNTGAAPYVFYIKSDDLETTSKEQIATWTGSYTAATNGVTTGFDVLSGGGIATFTLTGPADDVEDPAGTVGEVGSTGGERDLDGEPAVGVGRATDGTGSINVQATRFANVGFATTTFVMFGPSSNDYGTLIATTTDNGTVIPLGGAENDKPLHSVTEMIGVTAGPLPRSPRLRP